MAVDEGDAQWLANGNAHRTALLAPILVGLGVDCTLFGAIICQVVWWKLSNAAKTEHWVRICLVFYFLLVSLVHTSISMAFGYHVFVTSFGDISGILDGRWVNRIYIVELMVSVPIETFYAHRAWLLWKKPKWKFIPLAVLVVVNSGLGIAVQVKAPTDFLHVTSTPLVLSWLGTLLLLDWTISILVIIALFRQKTGFLQTDKMILKLIAMSAEAQIIPSLVALAFVLKTVSVPSSTTTFLFLGAPKVWIITCLVVISSRHAFRQQLEAERERRAQSFDMGTEFTQPTLVLASTKHTFMAFLRGGGPALTPSRAPMRARTSLSAPSVGAWDVELGKATVAPSEDLPRIPELEVAYLRPPIEGATGASAGVTTRVTTRVMTGAEV